MVTLFLFLFGLAIGSFISCLVYRINSETKGNRSVCDHCQKQLAWYDNIPLVSFLFLRGKCRQCHSPVPFQYFLVELATGILTIFNFQFSIFNQFSIFQFLMSQTIIYALIAIFVSDLNYQTVPEVVVIPAIFLALIYNVAIEQSNNLTIVILTVLAPTILFFLLSRLKIRGQQAMGFGDVEIAILMGLFLGFPKIIVALYLAFLTGALIGVILIILRKKKFGQTIPFGPFLIGGTIISLFWGEQIIKIFIKLSS